MADVFISYSQSAPEPTHALATELVQHGIDAWFDVNLLPGDAFGKVIEGEIARAKAVITIWSRPALTSIWVPAESQRALEQGKLLCVRTLDVNTNELPMPFNTLHTSFITDIDAILAGLAAKGVRRGKASIGGLQAEHGTMGEAAIAWQSVKESTDPAEIEAFIEFYYAAAFYRLLAGRRLERLRAGPAPALAPRPLQIARSEDVFLRIEAGMHTASIRRISLTADGRMMATGSRDKTVRLWSLPEGKLIRTLRPPIAPGNGGRIEAVALAPDGCWVAVGGWSDDDRSEFDGQGYVRIFDTATGLIIARLGPLPSVIVDLEVSPNGNRLAAAGTFAGNVRVWQTKDWRTILEDSDYGDRVSCLTFDSDSRLAVSSRDGYIRLYSADGGLIKKRQVSIDAWPYGIAFSPNGAELALGYQDRTQVDVLSAQTLAKVFSPDTSGVEGSNLASVAWLPVSERLAAVGRYWSNDGSHIYTWADSGRGNRQLFGLLAVVSG